MELRVENIYHARRVVGMDESSERHWEELKQYLVEEVKPQGFKYEVTKLDEANKVVVVVGYCGEFVKDSDNLELSSTDGCPCRQSERPQAQ